ncbi:unnamed protein product [Orchesella dallaii]|uniref:Uncharacterized protein n=1 Tax=Orchesella dallaii TaxID=48710 RepID=A0ABP1RI44_9HEXA
MANHYVCPNHNHNHQFQHQNQYHHQTQAQQFTQPAPVPHLHPQQNFNYVNNVQSNYHHHYHHHPQIQQQQRPQIQQPQQRPQIPCNFGPPPAPTPAPLDLSHQDARQIVMVEQRIPGYATSASVTQNQGEAYQRLSASFQEVTEHNRFLAQKFHSKETELQASHEDVSYLRGELDKMQQQYRGVGQQLHNLKGELETLKEATILKVNYDELVEQNKSLAESNRRSSHQNEELLAENKSIVESNGRLSHQNEGLLAEKEHYSVINAERLRLAEENGGLQENIANLNEKIASEIEKEKELERKNEDLSQNNKKLSESNKELENNVGAFQLKVKNLEEKLNESNKDLENNIEASQLKVKNLEEKVIGLKNCHKIEVEGLLDQFSKSSSQVILLNSKLRSSCDEVIALTKEKRNSTKKIEDLEDEKEKLRTEFNEKNSETEAEIGDLKDALIKKRSEILRAQTTIRKLNSTKKTQENQPKLDADRKQLMQQLQTEKERVRDGKIVIQEKNAQILALTQISERQKVNITRKSEVNSSMRILLAKTEAGGKAAVAEAEKLKLKVDTLIQDKDHLSSELHSQQQENLALRSERDFFKGKSNVETDSLTKKLEQARSETEKGKETNAALRQNSKILEEDMAKKMSVISLLQAASLNLEEKIAKLEQEAKEKDEKLQEKDEEVKSKSVRVVVLLDQLQKRELANLKLGRELEKEKSEKETIQIQQQNQSDNFHAREAEMRIKLRDTVEELEDLKKGARKKALEVAEKRSFIIKLLAEKSDLEGKLKLAKFPSKKIVVSESAASNTTEDQKKEAKEKENEEELVKEVKAKSQEIEELSYSLQQKIAEIKEANDLITGLRSRIRLLEEREEENKKAFRKQQEENKQAFRRQQEENKRCVVELCSQLNYNSCEKNIDFTKFIGAATATAAEIPINSEEAAEVEVVELSLPQTRSIMMIEDVNNDEGGVISAPAPEVENLGQFHDAAEEPDESNYNESLRKRFRLDEAPIPVLCLTRIDEDKWWIKGQSQQFQNTVKVIPLESGN